MTLSLVRQLAAAFLGNNVFAAEYARGLRPELMAGSRNCHLSHPDHVCPRLSRLRGVQRAHGRLPALAPTPRFGRGRYLYRCRSIFAETAQLTQGYYVFAADALAELAARQTDVPAATCWCGSPLPVTRPRPSVCGTTCASIQPPDQLGRCFPTG